MIIHRLCTHTQTHSFRSYNRGQSVTNLHRRNNAYLYKHLWLVINDVWALSRLFLAFKVRLSVTSTKSGYNGEYVPSAAYGQEKQRLCLQMKVWPLMKRELLGRRSAPRGGFLKQESKTHQWARVLQWVTCFPFLMNTGTVLDTHVFWLRTLLPIFHHIHSGKLSSTNTQQNALRFV